MKSAVIRPALRSSPTDLTEASGTQWETAIPQIMIGARIHITAIASAAFVNVRLKITAEQNG